MIACLTLSFIVLMVVIFVIVFSTYLLSKYATEIFLLFFKLASTLPYLFPLARLKKGRKTDSEFQRPYQPLKMVVVGKPPL